MPICKNCHHKWRWRETIQSMSFFNKEMICPYCHEKQYQSKASQALAPFSGLLILLPLLIQAFFEVPVVILLSLIPVIAVIIFMMFPFLIKLSNKEEYVIDLFKDK